METTKEPAVILIADSSRGRYIPQFFAESVKRELVHGVTVEDYTALNLVDHEYYWDTWATVLDNAELHINGDVYILHHDGDLWALCLERMTEEEKENFGFEDY